MRLALAIVLILLAATGCRGRVDTGSIVASGHVEATEVRVSTKVPGTLAAFPLEEGDRVAVGDELARIDTIDLRLALDGARAEAARAAAELRLVRAGPRVEEIAAARAQVERYRAELDGAEIDLRRMQELLDRGSGTEKARDDARTRRDVARARLAEGEEVLRRLEAGSRAEEIDQAAAREAQAQATVAQLEQQISDATITSPVAGVVTEALVEEGETVLALARLLVVTDLSDAWLTVFLPEPDLGRIRLGQPADVETDGGEKRTGGVAYVASFAEFTPRNVQTRDERVKLVYRIKIRLDNADGLFKPGMPATARLTPVEAGS
jgi:HlyD family secretion protein